MVYLLFVLLAPIAALMLAAVGVYTWRRRSVPAAAALGWCTLVIFGWLVANTLELVSPSEASTLFWAKITYLFIGFASVAWLGFALHYTGQQRWLALTRFWPLFVPPSLFFLLTLTNGAHHLIWEHYIFRTQSGMLALYIDAYGPFFWLQVAFNYALFVIGAVLIGRAYLAAHPPYRQQTRWALIGATAPMILNLVYVARVIPGFRKDYTPIAFAFGGLAFAVAIFRYRLFDLMPVARQVLVDRMGDGVIVLDRHDRIVDLNPAAQAIVGTAIDQALGYPVGSVWSAWGGVTAQLREDSGLPLEIDLQQQGERRSYDVRISRLADRRGRPTGRLVVLRDISRRRQIEELLRQTNLELEQRNVELDAFAHTVAHDVKGPLATIASYAQLLFHEYNSLPEDTWVDALQALDVSARKASVIVDELLLLASVRRVEEVELEALDMPSIVIEVVVRLADLINEYQAEIVMPQAWPAALGRGPWVEEVWVNYVSNAIRHGGMPPRVELGGIEQEDGTVRLWVRDNGAGLTPAQQEGLFVPLTSFTPQLAGGHGLGLSIVRRIVEKMGGHVGVESEGMPGKGCTFYFVLPGARGG